MKYRIMLLSAAAILSLTACGSGQTPQQQAFLEELANRPVLCYAGNDCKEKWGRAAEWVSEHSTYDIRKSSENLIQTDRIVGGDFRKYEAQFTVMKYAKTANQSVIIFKTGCDKGVKCGASALQLKANFNAFVLGLPPV